MNLILIEEDFQRTTMLLEIRRRKIITRLLTLWSQRVIFRNPEYLQVKEFIHLYSRDYASWFYPQDMIQDAASKMWYKSTMDV